MIKLDTGLASLPKCSRFWKPMSVRKSKGVAKHAAWSVKKPDLASAATLSLSVPSS